MKADFRANLKAKFRANSLQWLRPGGLLLSILLLSLVLVACGSDSTPVASSTTASQTTQASSTTTAASVPTVDTTTAAATTASNNPSFTPTGLATATAAPVAAIAVIDPNLKGTLSLWEALPSTESSAVHDLAGNFSKAYPGVKLNVQHYSGDELIYAAQQAAKSNKLPDLLLATADYVTDFQDAKAIQPADKVLDKSFLSGFVANSLAGSAVSGTQWGVPFTYSGSTVMLYNKKMVPNPPTTWTELGKTVQPLYDTKLKQIGLALDVNEPFFLTSILGGFGGSVLDSSNQPTLNTPQMVNSLQFIDQLLKDKVVRGESRMKDNQIEYAFRDGRLGIYMTSDSRISQYATAISPSEADAKLDLGVAPMPQVDKTGQPMTPFNNTPTFFLSTQTSGERLKLTNTFLNWVAQPAQQAFILEKAKVLPATSAFLGSDAVTKNPIWNGLLTQLNLSKPQPVAIQMRAVWDVLRPNLEGVVAGVLKPADAAKQMQDTALSKVANLATK